MNENNMTQQKEKINWSGEDEQNLNVCLSYIPDEALRRWLTDIIHIKYLNKSMPEVNPTWSEEDELVIHNIVLWLDGQYISESARKICLEWFNKHCIEFFTQPQPKQELSEDAATHEYIDLGLPSGTLWKLTNEEEYYTFDEAVEKFSSQLPSKDQWEELKDKCNWEWKDNGYKITGPNGNTIYLPAAGYHYNTKVNYVGGGGFYWSSTYYDEYVAWYTYFVGDTIILSHYLRDFGLSVRLVK